MLSARSVVTAVIVVAVLSLVSACVSLLMDSEANTLGATSYGTRANGHRALFETLTELKLPVSRQVDPPSEALDRESTLVFWQPHPRIIEVEPRYLAEVKHWASRGGRVVVAPPPFDLMAVIFNSRGDEDSEPIDLLTELGLPNVSVTDIVSEANSADPPSDPSHEKSVESSSQNSRKRASRESREEFENFDEFRDAVLESLEDQVVATRTAQVRASGSLAHLQPVVANVEVPADNLQFLELSETEPSGRLTVTDDDGGERIVVAAFPLEQGEVLVVSDPRLLQNSSIATADNSVLAAHLLVVPGRRVVFDEFYHGLTIRGNPFWLFTRRGYGAAALCLLAAIGLWIWRQAVFLGPPLADSPPSRRSIAEYVDAMGRFLNRGRPSYALLLQEVRDGVLHSIRHELGLPPGREHPVELAAVLARRDAARAKQLTDAARFVDEMLSNPRQCGETETIDALQRISACL